MRMSCVSINLFWACDVYRSLNKHRGETIVCVTNNAQAAETPNEPWKPMEGQQLYDQKDSSQQKEKTRKCVEEALSKEERNRAYKSGNTNEHAQNRRIVIVRTVCGDTLNF
eukprot:297025_1